MFLKYTLNILKYLIFFVIHVIFIIFKNLRFDLECCANQRRVPQFYSDVFQCVISNGITIQYTCAIEVNITCKSTTNHITLRFLNYKKVPVWRIELGPWIAIYLRETKHIPLSHCVFVKITLYKKLHNIRPTATIENNTCARIQGYEIWVK